MIARILQWNKEHRNRLLPAVLLCGCLASFARLHPYFSAPLDWTVTMMLHRQHVVPGDLHTLHPMLLPVLNLCFWLGNWTTTHLAMVLVFGTFHLASLALTAATAYRLFRRVWIALAFAALYGLHPCTQFLLASFEDNLVAHPFLLLAIYMILPGRPIGALRRTLSACCMAIATLLSVASIALLPFVGLMAVRPSRQTKRAYQLVINCCAFGGALVVAFLIMSGVNDWITGHSAGDTIQAIARAPEFARGWVESGIAEERFLSFESALPGNDMRLSELEFFLMAPGQTIYSAVILWPDWPAHFRKEIVSPIALLFAGMRNYGSVLLAVGFWFHFGVPSLLGYSSVLRFRRGLPWTWLLGSLCVQMLFSSLALFYYRDVPYERYDYAILLLPLFAFALLKLQWPRFEKSARPIGKFIIALHGLLFAIAAAVFFARYHSTSNLYAAWRSYPGDFEAYYFSAQEMQDLGRYTAHRLIGYAPLYVVHVDSRHEPAGPKRWDVTPTRPLSETERNTLDDKPRVFASQSLRNLLHRSAPTRKISVERNAGDIRSIEGAVP